VPRAQGRVTCTSFEAAMTDFIQRRSFFMAMLQLRTCRDWARPWDQFRHSLRQGFGPVLPA
jgi:hypothetical protein